MNPEGYVQRGRVYLLTLPGDRNEGLSRPQSSPTNDLKIWCIQATSVFNCHTSRNLTLRLVPRSS